MKPGCFYQAASTQNPACQQAEYHQYNRKFHERKSGIIIFSCDIPVSVETTTKDDSLVAGVFEKPLKDGRSAFWHLRLLYKHRHPDHGRGTIRFPARIYRF